MIVQFRNEKVSNHGSLPITIDCNVVAFIVFEEGFHQPIKRTKQSVFLDVTVFRHALGERHDSSEGKRCVFLNSVKITKVAVVVAENNKDKYINKENQK
ncbi:hypothetical protein TNCV_5080391 [Trichonephila clavipes]|nr:hypothetical protein TNCV_5080391 [Trichonephila clavipes]